MTTTQKLPVKKPTALTYDDPLVGGEGAGAGEGGDVVLLLLILHLGAVVLQAALVLAGAEIYEL